MEIQIHNLECQHPLGPHIHVVMPDDKELLQTLLDGFGVRPRVDDDLIILQKLATDSLPASKCTAYKLEISLSRSGPVLAEEAWAIVALRASIDGKYHIRAVFIRIDEECEIPGIDVAEMMRVALARAMKEYA